MCTHSQVQVMCTHSADNMYTQLGYMYTQLGYGYTQRGNEYTYLDSTYSQLGNVRTLRFYVIYYIITLCCYLQNTFLHFILLFIVLYYYLWFYVTIYNFMLLFIGHPKGAEKQTQLRQVSNLNHPEISIVIVSCSDAATVCLTTRGDIYVLHEYQCRKIASK